MTGLRSVLTISVSKTAGKLHIPSLLLGSSASILSILLGRLFFLICTGNARIGRYEFVLLVMSSVLCIAAPLYYVAAIRRR